MNCSVAQTLEVVGEWWTMLIVRDCFLGVTRFDDFHQRLGISRNILTDRLEHLVERGCWCGFPTRSTRSGTTTGSRTKDGICGWS